MSYTLRLLLLISFSYYSYLAAQPINLTVDAVQNINPISPCIYGRNNSLSDDPAKPVSAADWTIYKDANLRMFRESGGNNSTKYNWRLKLCSHPDWYNNVYMHDWDYSANSLLNNTSGTQGLYAFQLLGKVASNKNNNFNDFTYNLANGNINMDKNWAGGGGPVAYGGNGTLGNPNLYLENWTADSTVGILNNWFTTLSMDQTRFKYWNMDNEPEIWQSTHDDIASSAITAEIYMQKYFAVAKAARQKYPNIKLTGPVSPNEWQWYTWNDNKVHYAVDGKDYCWLEYFIKRIAEEEQASGVRLLDVIDLHFYPSTAGNPNLTLQLHHIWFDKQWDYSAANGVKVTGSGNWDNTITKEFVFERCNQWLTKYKGANHGVTFALSEYGSIDGSNANVVACWYASHLGVFANNGVEYFTPWDWYAGQWEVMNLFSNNFGQFSTLASSSNETTMSAYSSLSSDGDSLMIVVVNRDRVNARTAAISIQNFIPSATLVNGYQLANLPSTETFVSKSNNSLQSKTFTITGGNQISFSAPKLSVTLIQIPTNQSVTIPTGVLAKSSIRLELFPNPVKNKLTIDTKNTGESSISIHNMLGESFGQWNSNDILSVDCASFPSGTYVIQVISGDNVTTRKFIKE